ncbi:cyclic pyranopterin monophosphate synthase MoaC, partial [Helicobacter pullorum]
MVDVSNKEMTNREAIAMGKITMSREAFLAVINENGKKGAVIQTAIT